jgi:hypothetical protein
MGAWLLAHRLVIIYTPSLLLHPSRTFPIMIIITRGLLTANGCVPDTVQQARAAVLFFFTLHAHQMRFVAQLL